jgi:redox-sensitive bicupin YhaK (pirin superfamily)
MSWQASDDPVPGDRRSCDALELVIVPRARDLGGFSVRRALPSAQKQMVGPFIFWDQIGPAEFVLGEGIDVRPHPHIGLATVTYLFDGKIMHRDSLGSEQPITPGDVNWMTAGKGIVHSERTIAEWKAEPGRKIFGIQSWVALPKAAEEVQPDFFHHRAAALPQIEAEGKRVRVIAGSIFGETAPVRTFSEMFYADVELAAGAKVPLPADHEERAIYVAAGTVDIAGDVFEGGRLLVFRPGDEITVTALTPSRILLLGGEPMDGPRYIWWNFVSSSRERIEQAKEDWRQKRFDIVPGDEHDFIPLPPR